MSVPKLRFKEFDRDWKQETLKNLATFSKGKGISKADISEDGINLCIRYGELYTTYGQVIDHIHSRTNVSKSECILSKAGDVIIPASGETQIDIATASCVLHDDIILSGDLNILSHEENGSWLAYYLSSAKKLEIAQLAQGNAVVHLYSSQLKDLKINKPSKEEQTKIASFLSAVDEKISQLTQKHELLSQYKQGMMQKLFSQQIRFKADDGSEFGEWALSKLANYINEFKSTSKIQDEYEVLTSSRKGLIRQAEYFEGSRLVDRENIGYNIIQPNQITYRSRSDDGLFFFNLNRLGITGIISTYYPVFTMKNSDNRFFHEYLNFYKQEYVKYAVGTSQLVLSLNELRNMKFKIPCLEEQTKIANFLSAIDQKIEIVAQQIEQAKQWKKGLLQQMFV